MQTWTPVTLPRSAAAFTLDSGTVAQSIIWAKAGNCQRRAERKTYLQAMFKPSHVVELSNELVGTAVKASCLRTLWGRAPSHSGFAKVRVSVVVAELDEGLATPV